MERKDYLERILDFKNDILREIRDILGYDTVHYFAETFFVHYIEGEVATTEVCTSVEVDKDGSVIFHVRPDGAGTETEMIADESVFQYEPESFMDILFNLKKEIREEKLTRLRNIIKNAGGKVNFDGSFGFHSIVDGDHVVGEKSFLTCIEIDRTYENRVYLDCNFSGEIVEEQEENIPLDELDSLIAYVENQTRKKFTVKVSGSYSRMWEIEAETFQEAIEEAKKDWEINPLIQEDVSHEDWRSWQE